MLLVLHIFFALTSLGLMLAALLGKVLGRGDHQLLTRLSAGSSLGLVASGTVLVITQHSAITGACLDGGLYLGVLGALYGLYRKLAVA